MASTEEQASASAAATSSNGTHREHEEEDGQNKNSAKDPAAAAEDQDDQVETQQQHKRVKTDTLLKDVMSSEIVGKDVAELKAKYLHTNPFPFGHIPNLFLPDFLQRCVKEIKDNSVVNFKESDLFRVYQSIDLANLDEETHRDEMPHVLQLRSVLYSPEWCRLMEDFHDLPHGTLLSSSSSSQQQGEPKVDCACNCHAAGCHLLCHDDVIGTRKISYILYLTEPEPAWTAQEGGALELYDSRPAIDNDNHDNNNNTRRIPETTPCAVLLPRFNHLASFVVEPGVSFHAVQEVLGDRPRLSLQGWYHAAEAPARWRDATLQRLKSYHPPAAPVDNGNERRRQEEDTEGEYVPLDYGDDDDDKVEAEAEPNALDDDGIDNDKALLSDQDRTHLSHFLHPTYLEESAVAEICQKFEEDSSVQLRHFLNQAWVDRLRTAAAREDGSPSGEATTTTAMTDPTRPEYYQWGVSKHWQMVGPPHKQRFLEYVERPKEEDQDDDDNVGNDSADKDSSTSSMGSALQQLKTELLQSPAFGRYLGRLTSLGRPTAHRGRVRRFRPGRDYTVAHYGLLTETSVLDATLCFAAGAGGEQPQPVMPREEEEEDEDNNNTNGDNNEDTAAALDEADAIWQSGDCGGFECYIAADDDEDNENGGSGNKNEPAEEYNQDDDTELLSVSVSNNTLSLVYRDPGTMRFIKYLGARAPSSRWDVAMEYEVPGDDDDDDNDGEQEEAQEEEEEEISNGDTEDPVGADANGEEVEVEDQ